MKFFIFFLFLLPISLMAQNKKEKMPNHLTKIVKLQDVNVTGMRPHYVRLKGYYRSFQTNDSIMKYYNDGIVVYYINLKNGKIDLFSCSNRTLHNSKLVAEDKNAPLWLATTELFALGQKAKPSLSNIEKTIK